MCGLQPMRMRCGGTRARVRVSFEHGEVGGVGPTLAHPCKGRRHPLVFFFLCFGQRGLTVTGQWSRVRRACTSGGGANFGRLRVAGLCGGVYGHVLRGVCGRMLGGGHAGRLELSVAAQHRCHARRPWWRRRTTAPCRPVASSAGGAHVSAGATFFFLFSSL